LSFNVLAIRSGLDTGDDALHPVLSDASGTDIIEFDDYDGPNVMWLVATAVSVMRISDGGLKTLTRIQNVKIDVYITAGRLALACEKYDKGGGWAGFGVGGLLVAVTANAVSKARAARRSRGKALVGHIRYSWLKSVGASSKSGFTSTEAIRLEYSEMLSDGPVLSLIELTLPKNTDATLVAGEIARRAASYRLAYYPDMTAGARAGFANLSQAPPRLQPPPKKFACCPMPTYFHVSAQTAFPRSPRSGIPGPAVTPPQLTGTAPAPAFCTRCGVRHAAGDNFCAQCGTPVMGVSGYQRQHAARY